MTDFLWIYTDQVFRYRKPPAATVTQTCGGTVSGQTLILPVRRQNYGCNYRWVVIRCSQQANFQKSGHQYDSSV